MATLTLQDIDRAPADSTFAAASGGGDQFANDGRTYLEVHNGDASAKTVTINSQQACDQGFDHDLVVVVPAGEDWKIGPFPTARWNDGSGFVLVTYSAVTSVTVGAFKLASS